MALSSRAGYQFDAPSFTVRTGASGRPDVHSEAVERSLRVGRGRQGQCGRRSLCRRLEDVLLEPGSRALRRDSDERVTDAIQRIASEIDPGRRVPPETFWLRILVPS